MKSETRIPFYLAWKYLQRGNKWTMVLTVSLIAAAFVNLIFVTSLFGGIIDGTNKQIINTMTGNLYITAKNGDEAINNQSKLMDKIRSVNGVASASSEFFVPASLESNNYKGNWTVLAIDPDDEKTVTNVATKMSSGEYLGPDDTDSIIIGRQIAGGPGVEQNAFSFKGAKVGDKVELAVAGLTKEFTIKGIFYTKFIDTDSRAFISKKALETMIPIDDKASTIIIKTASGAPEAEVADRLKNAGIDENIYQWGEVAGLMKTVTKSFLSINILMTFVGIMIAAITIFIIIYIDILNKKREIGILRAIGIKPYIIFCSYIIQAAVFAVAGVILGTAFFFAVLVPYFNHHPFVLPICDAVLSLNKTDFIARVETITWVAVLSALIPSVAVTRTKILDSIFGR